MLDENEFTNGRRAFDAVNANNPSNEEIEFALDYLAKTNIYDDLQNKTKRNECFTKHIIKEFAPVLTDIEKVRRLLNDKANSAYGWCPRPANVESILRKEAETIYKNDGNEFGWICENQHLENC